MEEALCFGWIDGHHLPHRRRGDRHPLHAAAQGQLSWSAINIAKMAELKAAGRLHPAGLRAFEERDRRKDAIYSYERPPAEMPPRCLPA